MVSRIRFVLAQILAQTRQTSLGLDSVWPACANSVLVCAREKCSFVQGLKNRAHDAAFDAQCRTFFVLAMSEMDLSTPSERVVDSLYIGFSTANN
jgi:hypothetical protein